MIEESGSVIGIDVGCSPKRKSSAVCRLDWSPAGVIWEIWRFRAVEPERMDAIARAVTGGPIAAAAIDGPLRSGLDIIGRYRTAERMLTRRLRPLVGKPGQSSSPVGKMLNHHANECARHLLTQADVQAARHRTPVHAKALVEAFPSSFLGMMIDSPQALGVSRADWSDVFFRYLSSSGELGRLVEHCLPNRRILGDFTKVMNHDDRAGLVCALTALCVAAGSFTAVGDGDGWIILPPVRFIQPAQRSLLELNSQEEQAGSLYFEGRIECGRRSSDGRSYLE